MLTANTPFIIHWFRQDLRLADNPALYKAAARGRVMPIYILDHQHSESHAMGAASRWWLHHSLLALNHTLDGQLSVFYGDAAEILNQLIRQYKVTAVYWNRCYEPQAIQRDIHIKAQLKSQGIEVHSENSALLWEPWEVDKARAKPYGVFTPFYRHCLAAHSVPLPLALPETLNLYKDPAHPLTIDHLQLLPQFTWHSKFLRYWQTGERAAHRQLEQFLESGIQDYKTGRDFPAQSSVSRLSPYLHFGEISPRQIWHAVKKQGLENSNTAHFYSELGWREFSYSQLYYHPNLPDKNLQTKFDAFPWIEDEQNLLAWQRGQTGVPMVDAGMRELWETGYMHNRVRMIVASFLVKNLLIHWRYGASWFWDCLLDADLANNSAGWQWVAGCGADAAPYFRIFNPVTQGEKFDPEGNYIRRFIPELSPLPNKYLFSPWQAPDHILKQAGIKLGRDYPLPLVDLKASRERALAAFQKLSVGSLAFQAQRLA